MIGRTNAGGKILRADAVVKALYPAGSTCTCTNGVTTLRATDTTGTYIFCLPSSGEWTFTISNSSKTKSKTVLVAGGDTTELTLTYELVLYEDGEGFSSFEKYRPQTNLSEVQDGSVKRICIYNGSPGIAGVPNAVDITPYSTLYCTGYCVQTSSALRGRFGISAQKETGSLPTTNTVMYSGVSTDTTLSLDISTLKNSIPNAYIYIACGSTAASNGLYVKKLWLV